jgi:hypothetical protein
MLSLDRFNALTVSFRFALSSVLQYRLKIFKNSHRFAKL